MNPIQITTIIPQLNLVGASVLVGSIVIEENDLRALQSRNFPVFLVHFEVQQALGERENLLGLRAEIVVGDFLVSDPRVEEIGLFILSEKLTQIHSSLGHYIIHINLIEST